MKHTAYTLIVVLALLVSAADALPAGQDPASKTVTMYFFWQIGCTHCEEISPFMAELEKNNPQLDLKRFDVSKSQENAELFDETAKAYGKTAKVTPTIFVGDYMIEGYNGWITEDHIASALQNCTEKKCITPQEKLDLYKAGKASTTTVPVTSSSTTTTSTTTSIAVSTTSTTTTTTSQATLITTTTTSTTTSSIPQAGKKDDNAMLAGALLILAAFLSYYIMRQIKKR